MSTHGHFAHCGTPSDCWCDIQKYSLLLGITSIIFVAEVIGGINSQSLALLADAGHVLGDGVVILVTIAVSYLIRQGKDKKHVGNIGGVVNAVLLLVVAVWILVEAIERFYNPHEIAEALMISVALFGMILNYYQHTILKNMEVAHAAHKGLHQHIIGDLLQSGVVVIGGVIILACNFLIPYSRPFIVPYFDFSVSFSSFFEELSTFTDPVLSVGIAFWIGNQGKNLIQEIKSGAYDPTEMGHHH